MKRVTFQNSDGRNLAGVLHLPLINTKSAVIVSHGFTSTKDRPRFIRLSEKIAKAGLAALRFDFRGCGESESGGISVSNQVDDLKCAIKFLGDMGYESFGLVGESLGGLVTILACDKDVKSIVLWAPVTKSSTPTLAIKKNLKQELKEKSFIIFEREGKKYKILSEFFKESKSINQKKILSKIKCPVLIIHGGEDHTVPIQNSKDAMKYLSKESKVKVIVGGDHKLKNKMDIIIPPTIKWFKENLE